MITKDYQLKEGDVLSENSHYIIKKVLSDRVDVLHYESNTVTTIGKEYLHNYADSADCFNNIVEVTKEDKKDGTPGIRSIFENIHTGQVFTVCFKKQDKPKSTRQYNEEVSNVITDFSNKIDVVKNSKKGIADAAKQLVTELLNNPILPYIQGEDRVLRGYKIQSVSRDGRYDCVDMDIERTDKESGIRPVNINTLKWIILNGTKYVVK